MKDPKFNTTLYNHIQLSDGKLPLISNKQYCDLLQSVQNGDFEAYEEAKLYYCFEPKQNKMIKDIINKNIV